MNREKTHSSLNILLDNIEGTNLLLEYYNNFSSKIFAARDFKSIIQTLYRELRKIYAKQHIEFILWQNNKKLLRFTYQRDSGKVDTSSEIKTANTLYQYTLEQHQTILTNNYRHFCETLDVDRFDLNASSWLGIPMLVRERVLGMVVIWDESPEHYFRLQDKQFMSIITDITTFAVENVYLYEYIAEKNTQVKSAPVIPAPIIPGTTTDNLQDYLLDLLTQPPDVRYLGFFLRSQGHDKWRRVSKKADNNISDDLDEKIQKTLIYLKDEHLKQTPYLFWHKNQKDNFLQEMFQETFSDVPLASLLLVPSRIQHFYDGILVVAYEKRMEPPGPEEFNSLNFFYQMLLQIIEKNLLLEHKKSYEAYIQHLEKMKLVGELASGSAHHLNNILSVVTGRAQILHKKLKGTPHIKDLSMIEQAAEDGAQAVRRLQSVKTKNFPVNKFELLNVNDLILEVVEIARPRFEREAQSLGLTYDVKLTLGSVSYIKGDPAALREIFLNLITNAIDAMPEGGKLTIQSTMEKEKIITFFSDTGGGIPEDLREKIFEPFFSTKGERGNGLGLSIAADIIAEHRGKIYVDSIPNKGSIFMIELPAVKEKPLNDKAGFKFRDGINCRVLLVDDENVVGETLAEMLREEGCEVTMVNNPTQALTNFKNTPCDVVLTDLSMPGINGFELAKRVKEVRSDVPVILITGWNQNDRNIVKPNGLIDEIIEKPFNIKQIREAFHNILKKNGQLSTIR